MVSDIISNSAKECEVSIVSSNDETVRHVSATDVATVWFT